MCGRKSIYIASTKCAPVPRRQATLSLFRKPGEIPWQLAHKKEKRPCPHGQMATARVRQRGVSSAMPYYAGGRPECEKMPKNKCFWCFFLRPQICWKRHESTWSKFMKASRMAHCPRYCRIETRLVGLIPSQWQCLHCSVSPSCACIKCTGHSHCLRVAMTLFILRL